MDRQEELRARLTALGFDVVQFANADRVASASRAGLQSWLAQGMHADMAWMDRTSEKRVTPDLVLTGARSAVLLGVNYWPGSTDQLAPRWARYACYEDYHETVKTGLIGAGKILEEMYNLLPTQYRFYVDAGPVLERGLAESGGLGFIGKNAMLISRDFGNWLFLAEILRPAAGP